MDQFFGFDHSYRAPLYNPYRAPPPDPRNEAIEPGTGYRTLCVRLCDGYYFPISFSASLGRLSSDANVCRASCGDESRLFYLENSSDDIARMVDLSGRAYSNLPNAFRYRQTRVENCKCRPDPWAQSELARHKSYAPSPANRDDPLASKDAEDVNQVAPRTTPSDPAVARMFANPPEQAAPRPRPALFQRP